MRIFNYNNYCRFCGKSKISNEVRDRCHSTGKYRGPALNKCNIDVKQKQSSFIPFFFVISVIMIVNCPSKNSLIGKRTKTALHFVPKTNEEYISVTYGCIRFIERSILIKQFRFAS